MSAPSLTPEDFIGKRGCFLGDHPWTGKAGKVVRLEKTLVGYGFIVKLDDGPDVPPGQEAFLFEPKHWRWEMDGNPVVLRVIDGKAYVETSIDKPVPSAAVFAHVKKRSTAPTLATHGYQVRRRRR